MCPSPLPSTTEQKEIRPGQHHFIRNEYWEEDVQQTPLGQPKTGRWVQMAGTRLPDNRTNRKKLEHDINVMKLNGMRVRTVKYEVKEEIIGVIYGEGT